MGKVAVLGLGTSLELFRPEEYGVSIGVNDIWKYVNSDYVVCLNRFSDFNEERLRIIRNCAPKLFYSQLVIWDYRPDFRKIDFAPGYPDRICDIEGKLFQKSYCSPFVACQIAYKLHGADEIHLFGVDLINHPFLDRPLCAKIKLHFRNLKHALIEKKCSLVVHGKGILADI